ncbi:MAG: DUF2520 domain-containing protein [Ignavibacteria bacterium]|nr:DUF2520 domain-containing protein [Ignavibacteria bacterium]
MKKILIIGLGKLGTSLYYALKSTRKYKVISINSQSDFKLNAVKKITFSNIIILCVKDSQIKNTAVKIAKLHIPLKGKIIMHTSGALTSDEFICLNNTGVLKASFHPVQSFAKKVNKKNGSFQKIYVAIEGDKKAITAAETAAKNIGSIPFKIKKKNKIYHHICCVIASNYLSVLNYRIEEIGRKKIQINGFKNVSFLNIYRPLAEKTLKNISMYGAVKSLTGPIERNDKVTIKYHLDTLKNENFELLMFYILMGIETVNLAFIKKSLNKTNANKLYKLFSNYIIK